MPERCRVVVKARPTPPGEADALGEGIELRGATSLCVRGTNKTSGAERSEPRLFGVDRVYLADDTDLFDDEVAPLVDSVRCGYRATVFAYGACDAHPEQQGSGAQEQSCSRPISLVMRTQARQALAKRTRCVEAACLGWWTAL